MAPVTRFWLVPSNPAVPRAAGRIVAKGTTPRVDGLLDLGDHIAVAHHEGFADSPGGITVRQRSDFAVVREAQGAFGPIVAIGEHWLAQGPLHKGRPASTAVIEPTTLRQLALLPVCKPFAVLDRARFVAALPASPPLPGGLVEVDRERGTTQLVLEGRHDEFSCAALSPARDVLYAATAYGWVVAVRLADRKLLWERPPVKLVTEWAGYALALDPTGTWLALGGSGDPCDLRVLRAATGELHAEDNVCLKVRAARIAAERSVRIEALAFHPDGWLAAATNAGVLVEYRSAERISAFRAATRPIYALAFLDGGETLLVGGSERHLRVWPVDQL